MNLSCSWSQLARHRNYDGEVTCCPVDEAPDSVDRRSRQAAQQHTDDVGTLFPRLAFPLLPRFSSALL